MSVQDPRSEAAVIESPCTSKPSPVQIASWILIGTALLLVLRLHLLTALLSGLLVFQLVHMITPMLQRRLFGRRPRIVAVALLAAVIVGLITAAVVGLMAFLRSEAGSLPTLLHKVADILERAKTALPTWAVYMPETVDELQESLLEWLNNHATELRLAGTETLHMLANVLIGLIVGAMLAMHEAVDAAANRPLAAALAARATKLGDAFRRVVFAQVRISLINTTFTAIYLAVVLPLFGVHLPLIKTMIAITFVAGLLPVVGNLISNTVIVIVSLAYSVYIAIASLVFLVVIHKLEYFLNAKIIGTRIHAQAWELLVAMLAMEAAFGLPGIVAAPIYYAYVKAELADRGLI